MTAEAKPSNGIERFSATRNCSFCRDYTEQTIGVDRAARKVHTFCHRCKIDRVLPFLGLFHA